jgi:hypothetical protein
MADLPRLILPSEFRDPSGIVRVTPGVERLRRREREVVRANAPRVPVIAMTGAPTLLDQVWVYATHEELYDFIPAEVSVPLRAVPRTTADVQERVSELPFEPAMLWVASLQKALSFGYVNTAHQRWLAHEVYEATMIGQAAEMFLRSRERAAIFSEQQLFALQRLLVLYASDREASDLTPEEHVSLRLALFYVPGTVLQDEVDLARYAGKNPDEELFLRYFVSLGSFAAHGQLQHDLARAHRLYEVIAKSRRARRHRDYCPLDSWLVEAYGLTFIELQALGFSLHAGSKIMDQGTPPEVVTPSFFDSTALSERAEVGLDSLAANRDWFREEFERSREDPRRAALEVQPFLRRPGLRRRDGGVVVLAPRAIAGWLSPTGVHFRLLDLARARGSEDRKKFTRFTGFLHESYGRHLAHVAHPRRSKLAVGHVYGDRLYLVKKEERKTTDVMIDLGTDLVLIELTAKRMTQRSLVEADVEAIRDDLRMMVVEKMKALGRVTRDIFEDSSRVPDLDLTNVRRVWPMIVVPDGLFLSPSTWDHMQAEGGQFLDIPRSVVPAEVRPLVLLDLEELEAVLGLVEHGESLTKLLERKTSDLWVQRDFKSLLATEFQHRWPEEVRFIRAELDRAFRGIEAALDLAQARRDADEVDAGQQAA